MKQLRAMKERQQGLTMISWIFLIVIAVFVGLFAIRLLPIYMDHFDVVSSMKSLKGDPALRQNPTAALIRDHLDNRLDINDIDAVTDDDITITPVGNAYQVNVKYSVKTSFVYNISLVVDFNDTVEVP